MQPIDPLLPAKFKVLPDGVVITNAHGEILWFNAAFELMCGYTLEEASGRKPGSFLQGPKSDPRAIETMRAAIQQGLACSVALTNYHKDGHEYSVQITFTPVRKKNGDIEYFAAIEREFDEADVAQAGRENIERELQRQLRELVEILQREPDSRE